MRSLLIVNPAAGPNRSASWCDCVKEFTARRAPAVSLSVTTGPGHATQLARMAARDGFDRVVAVGGDGTANEVAQGLIGTRCALGLVPRGSGNGLARFLGIPLDSAKALRLAVDGAAHRRVIDTGLANGFHFINVMGFGFDAGLADRFSRSRRRGLLNYLRLGAASLRQARAEPCAITWNGGRQALDAFNVAVANSPQYGNGAEVAPGAKIDDGALDLVVVGKVTPWTGALLAVRLFTGGFDRHPSVRRLRAAEFTLHRAGAGLIHTDGEPRPTSAVVHVAVVPRSLAVVVPAPPAR